MAATKATHSGSKTPNHAESTVPLPLKLIELAPHGDIILAAGSPPTIGVKVSAQRLTEMSLVFERMLSGHFAESQINRSNEAPQQVNLPDDDAQGLSDLCHLLYHQVDGLDDVDAVDRSELPAERIYQLVKVADKYDCVDKLRIQLKALLKLQMKRGRDTHEWGPSAMRAGAAYLLGDAKVFEIATYQLTTRFYEPLSNLRKLPGGDLLPPAALLAMAEKRAQAQRFLCDRLGEDRFVCMRECRLKKDYRERHRDALYELCVDDWPPKFKPGTQSLQDLVDCMRSERSVPRDKDCRCESYEDDGVLIDAYDVAETIEHLCGGLCLPCVREDSVEIGHWKCVHKPLLRLVHPSWTDLEV